MKLPAVYAAAVDAVAFKKLRHEIILDGLRAIADDALASDGVRAAARSAIEWHTDPRNAPKHEDKDDNDARCE